MIAVTASTTHLIVTDAGRASTWYQDVFGAREYGRITLDDGRLIHVELRIGPLQLMLADEFPEVGANAPSPAVKLPLVFYLHTPDVDSMWHRALRSGAVATRPLSDAPWGEREGQLRDPFGYRWGITQRVYDLAPEDLAATMRAAFASQ
jgi:PhnB protein